MKRRLGPPGRPGPPRGGATVWLFGLHPVRESLRGDPGRARRLWLDREDAGPELAELGRLAREAGVPVEAADRRRIEKMARGARHQGAALLVERRAPLGLDDLVAGQAGEERASCVLVALDQIQDPHNLGAIARSAANLGARGLLVPDRRSAPAGQAALTASAGALSRLPLCEVVNLGQALRRLKDEGFWIYGADPAGTPAWAARFNRPLVLVVGSEGGGIRSGVASACDALVAVPQQEGGVESLNASCAASVLLYEIARQAHAVRAS